MSLGELDFIEALRAIATHPAARGLADDAAVLGDLVLTHDSIAEGVHFLPNDPPASVGWKLVAVNLSDLAAKGAEPLAALMSVTIAGDGEWEEGFLAGVAAACEAYRLPLVGGDTIALADRRPARARADRDRARRRRMSRRAPAAGPATGCGWSARSAMPPPGWPSLQADRHAEGVLVEAYRRPVPLLAAGRALAPHAHAMMDVSDGLLLDLVAPVHRERVRRHDRPRCLAADPRLHRRARAAPRRAPVRRHRGRRLCAARARSRPTSTPIKPLFTARARW